MLWLAFIQVFEKRVTRNDQVRLQLLETQLTGDVFYGSILDGLSDYLSLKGALESYYGDGKSPRSGRVKLRSLVQGVDEGLSSFASRTYRLIRMLGQMLIRKL